MKPGFIIALFLSLSCNSSSLQAQNATFELTTVGTTPAMDSAIWYCLDIWSENIYSSVPINIRVVHDLIGGGFAGMSFGNNVMNFPGAPMVDTWYPTSLANAIVGYDTKPGEVDMDIFIRSSLTWYLGTDGNPGLLRDFPTLFMHEVGHSLGIESLTWDSSGFGSYGLSDTSDFPSPSLSYSQPDFEGLPTLFDRFIINEAGQYLTDTSIFTNNSTELHDQFVTGTKYFAGPLSFIVKDSAYPELWYSNPFQLGTSMSHLFEDSFMKPFLAPNEIRHQLDTVLLAIYKDLGWPDNDTSSNAVGTSSGARQVRVYPNPFLNEVTIAYYIPVQARVSIQIFDLMGRKVKQLLDEEQASGNHQVYWKQHDNGISRSQSGYIYKISYPETIITGLLIQMANSDN